MATRKILQIMPAQGWVAQFAEEDQEYLEPLVGWALVQEDEGTAVVGLIAGETVILADTSSAFAGYAYVPEIWAEEDFDDDEGEDDDFDDEPPGPSRLN